MEGPTQIASQEDFSHAALVLLVSSDRDMAVSWMQAIQRAGPLCLWVESAERIAGPIADLPLRAAVLDMSVPRIWDLAQTLVLSGTAVIAVADNPQRRLAAQDRGCIEAIPTNMSPEEIARIVVRTCRGGAEVDGLRGEIVAGPLSMDFTFRRAFWHGEQVRLGPRLFNLLGFLAKHPGQPFGARELLANVWMDPYTISEGAVSTAIKKLRRLLDDHGHIVTRAGYGYSFVPDEPVGTMSAELRETRVQAS